MSLQRGDVVLATLPFVTRPGSKLRPVLVIQNDANNARMQNTIVAFITTKLTRCPSHDKTSNPKRGDSKRRASWRDACGALASTLRT